MEARKTLLSALVACLGCALFVASCAKPSTGTSCSTGLEACGSACVNTMTDPQNCGGCGKACATGQTCSGGACQCQSEMLRSDNTGVQPNSSNYGKYINV